MGRIRTLYHLTWSCRVDSILEIGLKPNYIPNYWPSEGRDRSKGKVFLCNAKRKEYWYMTYGDGWAGNPNPNSTLVWLCIDTKGLVLNKDTDEEYKGQYEGDFWTKKTIHASAIRVCSDKGVLHVV
jgi:hypothetical protein